MISMQAVKKKGRPATAERVPVGTYLRPDIKEALRVASFRTRRPICEVIEAAVETWCKMHRIPIPKEAQAEGALAPAEGAGAAAGTAAVGGAAMKTPAPRGGCPRGWPRRRRAVSTVNTHEECNR